MVSAVGCFNILLTLASVWTPCSEANAFLGRNLEQIQTMDAASLLEQLETLLGSDRRVEAEGRAVRIEDALRATYAAMPKNADGRLNSDTVRYMVHRYFVERHGWFVLGLDAAGDAWNSSSPAAIFKEHGEQVHTLFEDKLFDHKGFNLNQVAVFAATVESFIHSENLERLHAAYRFTGLSHRESTASEEMVTAVMETYMLLFVLGVNHSSATSEEVEEHRRNIDETYPTWTETQKWIAQVREEVLGTRRDTSFDSTVRVLEEIGDRYGRWQNSECLDLKDSLVKLEVPGTGRVRLDTFYKSALDGNWQFSESVAYLRQLGAFDEADAQSPSIIIPNYVNSPSNCVAASKFYSVCCIDECEALLSHLELAVAAPEASPARIAELVAALPSATVQAPRVLSGPLVQRLEEIATQHGGVVPFHGRLFAQWMHHAYPRECQFPHLSGTTKPLAPEMWSEQTGEDMVATEEMMRWHVGEAKRVARPADLQDELPWVEEEELFVSRTSVTHGSQQGTASCGSIALLLLIFALALKLVHSVQGTTKSACGETANNKYFV